VLKMAIANFDKFHDVLAMLTGLFQIALIVSLLFILIGVFMGLVGIPLFGKVIKKLKNTGGKMPVRKIGVLLVFSLIFFALVFVPITNASAVSGTAGTAGVLYTSSSTVTAGTVVSIEAEGLDQSADYDLRFTPGCADNFTFTTGAAQTEKTWHIKLSKPTTGRTCYVELGNTTASNIGILDEITIDVITGDIFIGADFLLDILAPLAILGVISVLLGTFLVKKYRNN